MRTFIIFGLVMIAKAINTEMVSEKSPILAFAICIAIVADIYVEFFRDWHKNSMR